MNNIKIQQYVKQLSNNDILKLNHTIKYNHDLELSAFYPFFEFNDLDFLNTIYQSSTFKSISSSSINEYISAILKNEVQSELLNRIHLDTLLIEIKFNEYKKWNEIEKQISYKFNGFSISSVFSKELNNKQAAFKQTIRTYPHIEKDYYPTQTTDIVNYSKKKHEAFFNEEAVQSFINENLIDIKKVVIENNLKITHLIENTIETKQVVNFKKDKMELFKKDKVKLCLENREEKQPEYFDIVKNELETLEIDQIDSFLLKIDTASKFVDYFKIDLNHKKLENFINNYCVLRNTKDLKNIDDAFLVRLRNIALNVKAEKYSDNITADMFSFDFDLLAEKRTKKATITQNGADIEFEVKYYNEQKYFALICSSNKIKDDCLFQILNKVDKYNKKDLENISIDDELIQLSSQYLYKNGIQLELSDGFY